MKVDLNKAECIQRISNIGDTIYTNICEGTYVTVSWGSLDWLILSLGVILAIMVIVPIVIMIRESW